MKRLVILGGVCIGALALTSGFVPAKKAAAPQPFALIELFTSEACSSCPAADKLMNAITNDTGKEGKSIFVVPLHIDYWDNQQWKDPYSSKQFTDRQNAYNDVLKDGVFTPQAIINGTYAFLGNNKDRLQENIKKALKPMPESTIGLRCRPLQSGAPVKVRYAIDNLPANTILNFAVLQHNILSHVLNGENGGRKLYYASATVSLTTIQPNEKGEAELPAVLNNDTEKYSVIAYLQDKTTMKVLAATESKL